MTSQEIADLYRELMDHCLADAIKNGADEDEWEPTKDCCNWVRDRLPRRLTDEECEIAGIAIAYRAFWMY